MKYAIIIFLVLAICACSKTEKPKNGMASRGVDIFDLSKPVPPPPAAPSKK